MKSYVACRSTGAALDYASFARRPTFDSWPEHGNELIDQIQLLENQTDDGGESTRRQSPRKNVTSRLIF